MLNLYGEGENDIHIEGFDRCGRVAAQQRGTHRRRRSCPAFGWMQVACKATPCGCNDAFNSASISGFEFADGSTLSITYLLARGFDLNARMRGAANDASYGNVFGRRWA